MRQEKMGQQKMGQEKMAQQPDDQKDQSRQAGTQPERNYGAQPKTDIGTGNNKSRQPRATEGDDVIASDGQRRESTNRDSSDSKSSNQTRGDSGKKAF